MLRTVLAILCTSFQSLAFAQVVVDCANPRYDQEVFASVTQTNNVNYGSNLSSNGASTTLTMDIYQPAGDTLAMRPLIVWAHGGSFVAGNKTDADIVALCNAFAKRGYVCASINYRLGVGFPPSEATTKAAVWRAVQDLKAAIRFFRKDAATANLYRIDPSTVFAGGSSAGAFMALHHAYLDDPAEVPAGIDTVALGGMEGDSGNPGYASDVNAIVNLCGALGDKTWIYPTDEPVCSMHGTVDNTVPYATAMIYLFGVYPIMVIDGSYSVNEYADQIGLPNTMYTFFGADHVPYLSNAAYMDTTVRFVSNFLYRQLGCTPADPEPLANTFPTTGLQSQLSPAFRCYPNPAATQLMLEQLPAGAARVRMLDLQGRVMPVGAQAPANRLDLSSLKPGCYILQVLDANEAPMLSRTVVKAAQ